MCAFQRKPLTVEAATVRIETLCARAEVCSFEVLTKLARWGVATADAQKILSHLIESRFVDDARYARSFVNDKYRFGFNGRIKLRLALAAKRIARDIIDDAMQNIDAEAYNDRITLFLQSKIARTADIDTYEGRNRVYQQALRRGYESSLVAPILRSLLRK